MRHQHPWVFLLGVKASGPDHEAVSLALFGSFVPEFRHHLAREPKCTIVVAGSRDGLEHGTAEDIDYLPYIVRGNAGAGYKQLVPAILSEGVEAHRAALLIKGRWWLVVVKSNGGQDNASMSLALEDKNIGVVGKLKLGRWIIVSVVIGAARVQSDGDASE